MKNPTLDETRKRLISILIASLSCDSTHYAKHPLRIVQAGKSLIGMNPEKPILPLINWLEGFVHSYKQLNPEEFKVKPQAVEDFASMIEFEIQLKHGNTDKLIETASKLLSVSSGEPLFESLLLHSCKNADLFPFYLSLYRSVLFCQGEEKAKFLGIGLKMLKTQMESNKIDESISIELQKLSLNRIDLASCYMQVFNMPLIRGEEIKSKIPTVIFNTPNNGKGKSAKQTNPNDLRNTIIEKDSEFFEKSLTHELFLNDRMAFYTLIKNIPEEKFSAHLILLIDSGRTIFRYGKQELKPELIKSFATEIRKVIFDG